MSERDRKGTVGVPVGVGGRTRSGTTCEKKTKEKKEIISIRMRIRTLDLGFDSIASVDTKQETLKVTDTDINTDLLVYVLNDT